MAQRTIVVPRQFDLLGLREFLGNPLDRNLAIDRIIIDNADHQWIEPVGLVSLAAAIRNLRYGRTHTCAVDFTAPEKLEYWQRMDLLSVVGIERDEGFRRYPAAGRFMELCSIGSFGEVDLAARRLLDVVPDDPDLRQFFYYCLSELLNNAFQHGASDMEPQTCAQVWPDRRRGQIAVADCGIGIKRALEFNPDFRPATDAEAISLAMRPWTSGRAHLRGPYAEYGTKGNGLFVIRRLIEGVGGRLVIASQTGLRDVLAAREVSPAVGSWPGTVVGVEFPLDLPRDWLALMKPIWAELSRAPRQG